jgi:hypothetical protein
MNEKPLAPMIRFDSIKMPKMKRTDEGYLRGEAVVSRAGVFKYRNIDGSIRGELRHPDDIFKKDSLDSLKMIPVTNDHPPEFIDASNAHQYQVGQTGERYDVDNDEIIVSMTVTHQDAIDAIEAGKLELSMGYTVDLKQEHGDYEGIKYDARQLAPKYNHLAIVKKGRAGTCARLRFDNSCELVESVELQNQEFINLNRDKDNMKEDSGIIIDALNADKSKLETKLAGMQSRLDLLEEEGSLARKELETERALKTDAILEAKVMDRVDLIIKAKPFIGDLEGVYKKTDREIMEEVINSLRSDSMDFKDLSDDYVRGVFETSIIPPREHMDKDGKVYAVMSRKCSGSNNVYDVNKAISERLSNQIFNLKESN